MVAATILPLRPSTANCFSVSYHTQPLDHFSYTESCTLL